MTGAETAIPVSSSDSTGLGSFHPLVRRWFLQEVGEPTEIQALAWPVIGQGRHVLIIAPTGSGKTLTAFLWALNQLIVGAWSAETTRVLYVSPLRALNNDIQKNLIHPLARLKDRFTGSDASFPKIRVLTRSGDTPAGERQSMQRRPPSILITTPESLNILLTSIKNRMILQGITTVILDEIHNVLDRKRGVHLISAVDRLVPLAGDFQRIGLSATVKPVEEAAAFLGGYRREAGTYRKRAVEILQARESKKSEIRVSFPEDAREKIRDDSWWDALADRFREIIRSHRSTLFFTNSRRLAEKVARLINEGEARLLAYSHHGSLSREIRLVVEQRLKNGELPAIVATNSLELGIDIGAIDQVVMVQTPFSLSGAMQKLGRSGHQVGATSRGVIFPTHGRDFLDAVVTAEAVANGEIEEIHPIEGALDVLAQILVSMTSVEEWTLDGLFDFLRTTYPYHTLKREHFDLVLDMLTGRYAGARIRELNPRISIDALDGTARAREGARFLVYLSGGTIPDRGYYSLRLADGKAKIGELDEEFVWERSVGESFTLGTQSWRIQKIDSKDVQVVPLGKPANLSPFWKAENRNRDFTLSEKIGLFLEEWNAKLSRTDCREELERRYHIEAAAGDELLRFLARQKEATGAELPHRHHLVIERFRDPADRRDSRQVILHTLWGGKVNQPFAIALAQAWEEKYRFALEVTHDNDAVMINLPHDFEPREIFSLVRPEKLESLLRKKLEKTGFFGARFREAAGTALLLPRAGFQKRTPLWLNRLRAKKLLSAVMDFQDFPVLLETWRTCLQDEFDLPNLVALLDEIQRGDIRISEVSTAAPSPFSSGLIWRQTNTFMYEDDTPKYGRTSQLRDDFIHEALLSSRLRPNLDPELVREFAAKLSRTAQGYSPAGARELLDWVKERILIPSGEWQELTSAMERDHQASGAEGQTPGSEHRLSVPGLLAELDEKLILIRLPGASETCMASVEILPRLFGHLGCRAEGCTLLSAETGDAIPEKRRQLIRHMAGKTRRFGGADAEDDPVQLAGEWLRYYGPIAPQRLTAVFGEMCAPLRDMIKCLTEAGTALYDTFAADGDAPEICDAVNLERLLYLGRRAARLGAARPPFEALDIRKLPLFLAGLHGLTAPGDSVEDLKGSLERLFGFPLPASSWEREVLPCRIPSYQGTWLDSLMAESDLLWLGTGKQKLTFCFQADLDLFETGGSGLRDAESLFADRRGRYSFWDLTEHSGLGSADLSNRLWNLAWKGRISNSAFSVIRKGIASRFMAVETARRTRGRPGFGGWQSSRPLSGSWYMLPRSAVPDDPLEKEEICRARIQLLIQRYGVLFRELLGRELPGWRWGDLFRSLRLMELSGEIFSGYFFQGIPGLQFVSPEAYRGLSRDLDEDAVFWISALDPVSPCGLGLETFKGKLPKRLAGSHLVYHGSRLAMDSRGLGREVTFHVEPDEAAIHRYLRIFQDLLNRSDQSLKLVRVEKINGEPALSSPYRLTMLDCGFVEDYRSLVMRARYR